MLQLSRQHMHESPLKQHIRIIQHEATARTAFLYRELGSIPCPKHIEPIWSPRCLNTEGSSNHNLMDTLPILAGNLCRSSSSSFSKSYSSNLALLWKGSG